MATILCRNIQCIHFGCHVYVPLVADLLPDFLLSLLSSCLPTLPEVTWGGYEAGGVPNRCWLQFITLTTLRVASTQAPSHLLGGGGVVGEGEGWEKTLAKNEPWQAQQHMNVMAWPQENGGKRPLSPCGVISVPLHIWQESWPAMSRS